MKKSKIIATVVTLFFILTCGWAIAEEAPQKVKDLATSTLAKLGSDPVIVAAVKAENAKGKTLDQIKSMDGKWKATAGIVDYMKALMDSDCGQHLRQIQDFGTLLCGIVCNGQPGRQCGHDRQNFGLLAGR